MGKFQYGGQAVIEGVMMRGPEAMAIAVRTKDEEIVVEKRKWLAWSKRHKLLGLPLVRGVVALVESLVIGMSALNFSANLFAEGEGEELSFKELALTILIALGLTFLVFVAFPAFVATKLKGAIASTVLLNIAEGLLKMGLFVSYIVLISRMEDIRRVFEYHGAEHKTIYAQEAGLPLTVENIRKFSTLHPRCGTSFLLLVFFVSIFIFSFFGRPPFWQRVGIHLAILPLVAGISYELIKLAGRPRGGLGQRIVRFITAPGMWLQRLTTREPSDEQILVAVEALRGVLEE
ncbi:MAG TPA: DUF1385 domain-containing protein [Bacillota bacterium]|nr:DUF1385 domain-containing protein [Bacillota bacterium]